MSFAGFVEPRPKLCSNESSRDNDNEYARYRSHEYPKNGEPSGVRTEEVQSAKRLQLNTST